MGIITTITAIPVEPSSIVKPSLTILNQALNQHSGTILIYQYDDKHDCGLPPPEACAESIIGRGRTRQITVDMHKFDAQIPRGK